jgi:hypothetical protein
MNTSADTHLEGIDLAGELIDENFAGWSPELIEEFKTNEYNYQVGSTLWSQSDKVKVWHISVPPGGRLGVHRHVLDYFWTALTDGSSIQHTDDGTTRRVSYRVGDTRHFTFGAGQYLLHDLCNDGTSDIEFLTVEHLRQPGDDGPRQD